MIVSTVSEFKYTNTICIVDKTDNLKKINFNEQEQNYIIKQFENKQNVVTVNRFETFHIVLKTEDTDDLYLKVEKLRRLVPTVFGILEKNKIEQVAIVNVTQQKQFTIALLETLLYYSYKFDKYKTNIENNYEIGEIQIYDTELLQEVIDKILVVNEGLNIVRDIVNEPYNAINSIDLANKAVYYGQISGYSTEVLSKKQIETLRMGGLLAVNKASQTPATFSILQWKPENAQNTQPIIFVGKGLVFDTGGYNLKTSNYMENMKQDKAGAATVIGLMYIVAKLNLPLYIIGLIPATDNVISASGTVTGDIIKMHDGTSVEILNTDAEGRLILADALSYAQKYNPQLVIDFATLTGTATRCLDIFASALFSKDIDQSLKEKLQQSSLETYELYWEFPIWQEYREQIKSKIADITNIGGFNAGHITAAAFLEHFVKYPWIHFDIAPVAFYEKKYEYYKEGATARPTKLIVSLIEKLIN